MKEFYEAFEHNDYKKLVLLCGIEENQEFLNDFIENEKFKDLFVAGHENSNLQQTIFVDLFKAKLNALFGIFCRIKSSHYDQSERNKIFFHIIMFMLDASYDEDKTKKFLKIINFTNQGKYFDLNVIYSCSLNENVFNNLFLLLENDFINQHCNDNDSMFDFIQHSKILKFLENYKFTMSNDQGYNVEYLKMVFISLFQFFCRNKGEQNNQVKQSNTFSDFFSDIVDFMQRNQLNSIAIQEMCRIIQLNTEVLNNAQRDSYSTFLTKSMSEATFRSVFCMLIDYVFKWEIVPSAEEMNKIPMDSCVLLRQYPKFTEMVLPSLLVNQSIDFFTNILPKCLTNTTNYVLSCLNNVIITRQQVALFVLFVASNKITFFDSGVLFFKTNSNLHVFINEIASCSLEQCLYLYERLSQDGKLLQKIDGKNLRTMFDQILSNGQENNNLQSNLNTSQLSTKQFNCYNQQQNNNKKSLEDSDCDDNAFDFNGLICA